MSINLGQVHIDENTLVTDACTVSDGSVHGGDVGANIIKNGRMTVWTDPNYGANTSDLTGKSGLYQQYYGVAPFSVSPNPCVGQLNFVGKHVNLSVGTGLTFDPVTGTYYRATLAVMPLFYFIFDPFGSGQVVTITPLSVFDYFGLTVPHNVDGSVPLDFYGVSYFLSPFLSGAGAFEPNSGIGKIRLDGLYTSDGEGHSETYPAYLKVHPGSNFATGAGGLLTSTYGEIDALYGPSIFPLTTGSPNPNATGQLSLGGQTLLTTSETFGNIPALSSQTILTITHGYEGNPQFDAESSYFTNNNVNGASELLIHYDRKPPYGIVFNNCDLTATKIHGLNVSGNWSGGTSVVGNITIENSQFNEIHGRCIFLENTLAPTGLDPNSYNGIYSILNNHFYTINSNTDLDDASHGTYGIYIKNFDGNFDGSNPILAGSLIVESNSFTSTTNWAHIYPGYPTSPNHQFSAAICFENTTGNIIGNTIKDPAYTKGIWLLASPFGDVLTPV